MVGTLATRTPNGFPTNYTEKDELTALGTNIAELDRGLKIYWINTFADDRVRLVYATHFFESKFETPQEWHMHIHVIPRFNSLEVLMPYNDRTIRGADAWKVPTVTTSALFPSQYRVQPQPQNLAATSQPRDKTFDERIIALMIWLRQYLQP